MGGREQVKKEWQNVDKLYKLDNGYLRVHDSIYFSICFKSSIIGLPW